MTRQLAARTLVVAVAFAAATAIGWWALPVAAAGFGALTARDRAGAVVAGVAAILAWSGLLIYNAVLGPVGTIANTLGGVLQMQAVAVYALTLAFAGLIAVCAAIVGRSAARALATGSAAD